MDIVQALQKNPNQQYTNRTKNKARQYVVGSKNSTELSAEKFYSGFRDIYKDIEKVKDFINGFATVEKITQ